MRFVRASGPGGQNVNKVATAVELRFHIARNGIFDEAFLLRLSMLAGRRLTREGIIVIRADRFRTQDLNKADALSRLNDLVVQAAIVPKTRRVTKTPSSARRKRLSDKKMRGETKAGRGRVDLDR